MAQIRIGELLKTKGFLNDRQLTIALGQQKITGSLLGDSLVKLGFITSKELGQVLAAQSGLEFIDLSEYVISEDALRAIPKNVAEKAEFIPLNTENGTFSIGITNPGNILAIDTAARIAQKQPRVYMVDMDNFRDAMSRAYFFLENPIHKQIENIAMDISETQTVSGPVLTSLSDLLIMEAIRRNATDIHVNPSPDLVNIFYRIDGIMQYGYSLPSVAHAGVVSRIKILSNLDIAEQRLPQDGSFTFKFLDKSFDIRVSTLPTIYGENSVMRILAGSGPLLKIENLGFYSVDVQKIKKVFHKPYGIILMTGPTGSGKTTTLYAALREINLLEINVITVEDPVEYRLNLVRQTQVNEKVGYDFSLAARNFMRQDPDVMLLGEIRDEETAKIAMRASITGHLVLSTLHTNDAVTAIPRLLDLNIDLFSISSALLAVLAQRLIRKICPHCKVEYDLNEQEIEVFKEYGLSLTKAFRGTGCPRCNGTGYYGRTVIGEILIIDDELREMIVSGASTTALRAAALRKGMQPLEQNAIKRAAKGVTTLEEALRVTGLQK